MMSAIANQAGRWHGSVAWQLIYRLHLILGLGLGLLFAIMGLTGSLLIFSQPLDQLLNSTLSSTPIDNRISLNSAVTAAASSAGDDATAWRFDLPAGADGMHTIHFRRSAAKPALEITVDPYTGGVTSTRERGRHMVGLIHRMHTTLLAGDGGRMAAGLIGLLLIFMLLSGVLVWWTRTKTGGYAASPGRTIHRLVGLLSAPILLVVSIGGVYLVFPGPFFALLSSGGTAPASIQTPVTGDIGVDQAVARARQEIPGGEVKRIYMIRDHYRVTTRLPGEPRRSNGMNSVRVHRSTGDVLQATHYRNKPAGERALAWLFPLHNGEALGTPWRLAVALAGMAPTILLLTGGGRWWLQRRRRTHGNRA